MNTTVSTNKRSLLLLALTPLFILSACEKPQQEAPKPPPMNVATISIKTEEARIVSTLPGRVNALKDADVRARVDGIVQSIHFEQGSVVQEGQLLFKIDPDIYQARVNQAQAALNQAQATSRSARSLANRYATLVKSNAVSKQEYDNAMANSSQSAAAVEAAKAALDSAKINLSYTDVVSPINGVINRNLVTEGALVSAMGATPMAKVQQLNDVYVDFTQSTAELSSLRRALANGELERAGDGESASVTLLLEDGTTYEQMGKLLFSGLTVDPATGKVNLRAIFPNPNNVLLPGMFVRVEVIRGINKHAIMIPTQALQRRSDGGSNVLLVKEGKVVPTVVKESDVIGSRTLISEGISVGDELIVEGFSKIGPGMPVNPVPWKNGSDAAPAPQGEPAASPSTAADTPAKSDAGTASEASTSTESAQAN